MYFAFGVDKDGDHLVLVGTDKTGEPMWDGTVINRGVWCPPYCPPGFPPQDLVKRK